MTQPLFATRVALLISLAACATSTPTRPHYPPTADVATASRPSPSSAAANDAFDDTLAEGEQLYAEHCVRCHQPVNYTGAPDLLAQPTTRTEEEIRAKVRASNTYSMPSFSEETLAEAELSALTAYLLSP